MTSPLRHAVDLLSYAATRSGHQRRDHATVSDLAVDATDLDLPAGLEIRWLGVAGFVLTYQQTTVLIDPYVSRAAFGDMLRRRTVLPDRALVNRTPLARGFRPSGFDPSRNSLRRFWIRGRKYNSMYI